MEKVIAVMLTCFILASCGSSNKIQTNTEKIGNLKIEAPVGWDKEIDDSYDTWTSYSYVKYEGDKYISGIVVYVDKETNPNFSISDFDYIFEDSHDGIDIIFYETNDEFLGNKPIRKGYGIWQYNYNGEKGDLYDRYVAAMYDADCRKIMVDYMYLDSEKTKGYEDFANTLFDKMVLTYDYQ